MADVMNGDVADPVLERLPAIHGKAGKIDNDPGGLRQLASSIAWRSAGVQRDMANIHSRLDRQADPPDRIECRLELAETPA